ncbi:MAG: hypothetical protein FWB84_00575 [Candidatus Bathyarchaeota archaeon]|uniref:hypothetical protein n=1 Tax=Candidatus Bathycorpusculum sp. TaxID=2994959 RepID=UPI00282EC94A|nr:hypothetical protein [Candidatus Termiticorpusculum sp.]MCL2256876.1 hypothetical protein [Candidatus Termiticorpusculum sp.]MCL2292980.1 hypothetical protein [Candidatus Termiticorpusculum sp.]
MNFRSKKITGYLILMVVTSYGLLMVEPSVAVITVSDKPSSGPEIDSVVIYNTPVWTVPNIIDSYTGAFVTTGPGFWTQNGTVEITIKNTLFMPYTDENGNSVNTYYSIFYKTENSSTWMGVPLGERGIVPIAVYQTDFAYTVIDFSYGAYPIISAYRRSFGFYSGNTIFRIQTVEQGYFNYSDIPIFEGVGSEWTEFTITIPSHNPYSDTNLVGTSKPNIQPILIAPSTSEPYTLPTSDSYIPPHKNPWSYNLLIIIFITMGVITIPLVIIVYRYRKRKNPSYTRDSS